MSRATALVAALLSTLVGLSGCGDDTPGQSAEPKPQTAAVPARDEDRSPAAAAGGACQLFDFFAVEQLLGIQFEVAAAAQREATATCVLQRSGASYPDLTFAITPATVNAAGFKSAAAPPGSTELAGVGQAAYQVVRPASGADPAGPGPSVEIGWLTRTNQFITVRYRLGGQEAQKAAEDALPRVVELAKFLDPT
jgi:hypothetical protein